MFDVFRNVRKEIADPFTHSPYCLNFHRGSTIRLHLRCRATVLLT